MMLLTGILMAVSTAHGSLVSGSIAPRIAAEDDSAPQLLALAAIVILVVWAGSAWRSAERRARRMP